ncbi:response regulator transcription factor [Chitinilyticum aquatile]|uniref:response regulator transcription factor n=1 Tax=Chitinilyticum aquatile TaxID=362520 RepID=UPI0004916DA1|nr:response regulator [Chitinilyticum aquatile]
MQTPCPIALIDDDPELLDALTYQLDAAGYAVKAFGNAAEFFLGLSEHRFACIVCDYHMAGMNGLDVLRMLQGRLTDTPFIMLTAQGSVALAVHAMKAGSVDFVEKGQGPSALLHAIASALARRQEEHLQREPHLSKLALLTSREREVLDLLAAGLSAKECAAQLACSPRTVETHRASIGKKLGLDSAAQMNELLHLAGEK